MYKNEHIDWEEFINYKGPSIIPGWVKNIEDRAYFECRDITEIEISEGVESIGADAFKDCTHLKSISIPSTVTSIGTGAFAGCRNLETIVVDIDNNRYMSEGSCCLSKDGRTVVFGCSKSVIPSSARAIGDEAFRGIGLTSVKLPFTITAIGNSSFAYNGSLKQIELPPVLKSIGNNAFLYCDELTSIEIPESVKNIGENVFWGCNKLEKITLRDGILEIGRESFADCGVKKIQIPRSVREIGENAFCGCDKLTAILIPESVSKIGDNAFYKCRIHHIFLTSSVGDYDGGPLTNLNTGIVLDYHILEELNRLTENDDENCYNAILHVPTGTEEGYRKHPFFKDFKDIVPWEI